MRKILIKFDYRCFPLWIYDNEDLVDNDLPPELLDDKSLDKELVALQEEYDNLFIDDDFSFSFSGFADSNQESQFIKKVMDLEQELILKVGDKYIIQNDTKL
ncbi:TPA: hypothetical protein TXL52_001206 [Streptococcus suis]|nr:hypothetical protein [Streptococcus suis]